jgi:endonuclease/exonuclease/phosphatase (EEP) superfamily protein YafD
VADQAVTRALRFVGRLGIAAVGLAAIGLALVYVIAWIPAWPLALFEHFRVQYVVIGAVVTGLTAALRMRGYVDIAAIATLLHALPVAADVCQPAQAGPADGVALRVLVLNVHTESTGFDAVRRLIADEQPDLIGLVEVDRRWLAGVAAAVAEYPGRIEQPRDDNFGVALYARGELRGAAELAGSEVPTVFAELTLRGARLRVILTHPPPPVSGGTLAMQYRQLAAIAPRAAGAEPVVIMGDFNATPWSRPFAWLRERTALCDSRAGFGIQASFPAMSAVMRIPIDHLLASCAIGVRDRRIGRDVGSDHLPVLLELVVPRSPAVAPLPPAR